MHMCVFIASVCKLLRTVLPTCCKKCLWSSANYQLQHTHTLTDTQRFNQLCTTGGALAACKHTHIYNCYVCAQGKQKTKHKTKHKRKTNNNNSMRKNQLTSSSLLLLCCWCVVVVLLFRCSCCWPCQQVGARAFGFGKVINFQLSLFVCLLFLA